MALLFMDGFDVGDYAIKGWNPTGNFVSSTVAGRVSGLGLQASLTANSSGGEAYRTKIFTAANQVTIGVAVQVNSYTNGGFIINLWGDSGVTKHLSLCSNPTSQVIELRRAGYTGTIIASTTTVIPTTAWTYFEIQATIADAGGTCVVRMNGNTTPIINFTGDTRNGGTSTNIDAISLGGYRINGSSSGGLFVYDDLYILDGTGGTNNTFLGDVRIASLQPNGVGIDTQLTPTGSATNWQNVDEIPYSTTDYNGSSTVGLRDTYTLTDLPGTVTTVHGLQSNIVAAKSDATTAGAKIPIRTGGSVYYGATNSLSTTYLTYSDIHSTNPNTTVAWTPGDVNGLEAGMEVS